MPSTFEGPLDRGRDSPDGHKKRDDDAWRPSPPSGRGWGLSRPAFMNRISPLVMENVPLRRTAWLDGLRGFAAFLVYWHHHHLWAHDDEGREGARIYENAWGYEGKHYLVSLPFVRLFFSSGHYAVAVFYVISGYVLSTKSLTQIHSGEQTKAAGTLSSALFRRWMRLYLPVAGLTLIYWNLWHLLNLWVALGQPQESWYLELKTWWRDFVKYSSIMGSVFDTLGLCEHYNFYAWSIPTEFKGSIVVYVTVMALARLKQNARLLLSVALVFYFNCIAVEQWHSSLFLGGMLLSDLDVISHLAPESLPSFFAALKPYRTQIFLTTLAASFYLGGIPAHDNSGLTLAANPGWYWIAQVFPFTGADYKWFYLVWAGILLVASVPQLPALKRFFETDFCQYLARISYALYLVHGPVLWTLGDRVYHAVGFLREDNKTHYGGWVNAFPIPEVGPMGLTPRFWLPQLLLLPLTLWLAEIATVMLDEPSVKAANWLYQQLISQQSVKG